jgi:hypothetical protein
MNKATMIQHSKDMIQEFNKLIQVEELRKGELWNQFKNYSPSYDWKNEDNNGEEVIDLLFNHSKSNRRISDMKIAIQKIENLLITLEELK